MYVYRYIRITVCTCDGMYVCMYVAQLVRVCIWRLATSGTFGSEFECGRATYISSPGQGTNIHLPLSPECQFLSSKFEA